MSDISMRNSQDYIIWLGNLKNRIRTLQVNAAVTVNRELLMFYWELGANIEEKQKRAKWGDGLIKQLSFDLQVEFPEMKGFSIANLKFIRQWYAFYAKSGPIGQQAVSQLPTPAQLPENQLVTTGKRQSQQPVGRFVQEAIAQITAIPWGHNIAIISKCKQVDEAFFYVRQTIQNNWSRSVLIHQIESGLFQREGKATSNFAITLPKPQSDLAQQTLKDPYIFDFLTRVCTMKRSFSVFCAAAIGLMIHSATGQYISHDAPVSHSIY